MNRRIFRTLKNRKRRIHQRILTIRRTNQRILRTIQRTRLTILRTSRTSQQRMCLTRKTKHAKQSVEPIEPKQSIESKHANVSNDVYPYNNHNHQDGQGCTKTGDNTHTRALFVLCLASLAGMTVIGVKQKRQRKDDSDQS